MSDKNTYVLAHDVGTSSVKSALVSQNGEIASHATSSYGFSYPHPGWVEQDPQDYWKGVVKNTRKIIEESRLDPSLVMGMVFSTQAMGIINQDSELASIQKFKYFRKRKNSPGEGGDSFRNDQEPLL